MARLLGSTMPDALYHRLGPAGARGDGVVLLLTVEPLGFPHTCLLSYYQVLATAPERVVFVTARNSRTARNLREGRGATFVFGEIPACYYVKGRATELREARRRVEGVPHTIFDLRTSEVLVDESAEAPLRTGLTFDASKVRKDHRGVFDELRALVVATPGGTEPRRAVTVA